MQPGIVTARQMGDFHERIDGAGVHRAGGSHHGDGHDSGGDIGTQSAFQFVGAHAVGRIGRDDAQVLTADAQ